MGRGATAEWRPPKGYINGPFIAEMCASSLRRSGSATLDRDMKPIDHDAGRLEGRGADLLLADLIDSAERYVISPPVWTMANDLSGANFGVDVRHLPDQNLWFEWTQPVPPKGQRDLSKGVYDAMCGVGVLIAMEARTPTATPPDRHFSIFLHHQRRQYVRNVVGVLRYLDPADPRMCRWDFTTAGHPMEADDVDSPLCDLIVRTLGAIWELINHPRAVRREDHAAQKAERPQPGQRRPPKPAVPAYSEILIHVTREERDSDDRAGSGDGPAFRKRMHHVRPFARVRNGKPELVVGHWRGDPKLGIVPQRAYRVVP